MRATAIGRDGRRMSLLVALYVYFISPLLTVLFFIMFAWVISSWLVSFGIVDRRNPNARAILGFLAAICEPLCRPIRRIIPPINGVLDLSPLLVVLVIVFLRDWAIPELIMMASGAPRIG
jgi:YggT family protein